VFERFTDSARRTVVLAQEESRLLSHDYIGTEHLLLGLVVQDEGTASHVLRAAGVMPDAARSVVVRLTGQGRRTPAGHIPFTAEAKKVLEQSLRHALELDHEYLGTEHLLLGLLDETDGVSARALRDLGCDAAALREQALAAARSGPPPDGLVDRGDPMRSALVGRATAVSGFGGPARGAVCSFCGRDLWEVDRHVASARARICEDCVEAGRAAIERARSAGRPVTEPVRLEPRLFGPPPPDDRAVDAVIGAYATVFGATTDDAARTEALQDGSTIGHLIHQARARFPQASDGVVIEALRFVEADLAEVRFSVLLGSGPLGAGGFPFEGQAVLRDGRWQVSRQTFCQLLAMAGVHCPPPEPPRPGP
jgi:hypothetical protein